MTHRISLAAVLAFALVLAGCGGTDEEAAATTTAPTTTTTAVPTTTTAPPTTTTTAAPTTTTTAAPATTEAPTTTTPPLPDEFFPTHGGDAVAVYLGVVDYDTVEGNPADGFAEAIAAAEAMGYFVGSGDLACDQGGQDALELPSGGSYWAASVLFATTDDASAFVAAFPGDIVGIAEVTTFCLD